MERSGFFNAVKNADGTYDRTYRSEDYCNNLAAIISNGVVRGSRDDLEPTGNGMATVIAAGRGWINGHWYDNDGAIAFDPVTASASYARWDRVFLRLDTTMANRKVSLVYVKGTAATTPTKPAPTRTDTVYDLCICDVYVPANASAVSVTDTRSDASLCGWVYSTAGDNSFFTAFDKSFNVWFQEKKDTLATVTANVEYRQLTVLTAQTNAVAITIPQYDATVNQNLQVYVNGFRQYTPNDYTVNGTAVTFTASLVAGTEVSFYISVPKDGTGIDTVVDDVVELQSRVSALESGLNESTYNYVCNGVDDNVRITELVQAWLNGGSDYSSLKINVYGTIGIAAAYGGSGTSTSPYRWFGLGGGSETTRKVIVDFSACSQIEIACADNSYNVIFYGLQVNVIGANVIATGGAQITMFSTVGLTQSNADRCRFWITSQAGYITRGGTFRDCRCSLTVTGATSAFCFNVLSNGLLRLFGGEYYAYAPTGNMSAVIYVNGAQAGAVVTTYSISCPTFARSNYVQSYAINCLSGDACCSFTDTITALPITAAGQNIRGTIAKSMQGFI